MCLRKRTQNIASLVVCCTVTYIILFNGFALYSLTKSAFTPVSQIRHRGLLNLEYLRVKNWTCKPVHFSKKELPLTALASFPGSGNTWIRHVLQQASGVLTGSVYKDVGLRRGGLLGEGVRNSSVIAIKTHEWGTKERSRYNRTILLIRNPQDALLAEFNRRFGGHMGHALDIHFRTEWNTYVDEMIDVWYDLNMDWLQFKGPLHVIQYENFEQNTHEEIMSLLKFVNISISTKEMLCVVKNLEGMFKRPKFKVIRYDPFRRTMKLRMKEYIRKINITLKHINQKS